MIPAHLAPLLLDQTTVDDVTEALIAFEFWRRSRKPNKGEPPRPRTDQGAVLLDAIREYAPGVTLDTQDSKATSASEEWATFDRDRRFDPHVRDRNNPRKYSRLYMILKDHLPPLPRDEAAAVVEKAQRRFDAAERAHLAEVHRQMQIEDDAWYRRDAAARAQRTRLLGPTSG